MGIIVFIIFGAIVGWIASIVMGRNGQQGMLGNIVVGILGAFLGGWIMNAIGSRGITGFNIWSFLVALLGAVILLFVFNLFTHHSHRHAQI